MACYPFLGSARQFLENGGKDFFEIYYEDGSVAYRGLVDANGQRNGLGTSYSRANGQIEAQGTVEIENFFLHKLQLIRMVVKNFVIELSPPL